MTNLHSLTELKMQAKALRKSLAATGHSITHSTSLELLAKQLGYRDWNTLFAKVGNQPTVPYQVGQRVSGLYLGQKFTGELIRVSSMAHGARFGLTIRFDKAVDVVPFEDLSVLRKQIVGVVDHTGRSAEKTSNGLPQLALAMQ